MRSQWHVYGRQVWRTSLLPGPRFSVSWQPHSACSGHPGDFPDAQCLPHTQWRVWLLQAGLCWLSLVQAGRCASVLGHTTQSCASYQLAWHPPCQAYRTTEFVVATTSPTYRGTGGHLQRAHLLGDHQVLAGNVRLSFAEADSALRQRVHCSDRKTTEDEPQSVFRVLV